VKHERLDRIGVYTLPVWVGLFITGIYILLSPQVESGVSNFVENLLGLLFSVGAAACLTGVFIKDWRAAYKLEIVGLVLVCAVLGVLAWVTNLTLFQQFTMAGGLGALVQIGSIRGIVTLWWALYHDK